METDKTTLNDLSIFTQTEELSVVQKLDKTRTSNGRLQLYKRLSVPLATATEILAVQESLKLIISKEHEWSGQITNGTIKVIESFFETALEPPAEKLSKFSAYSYRVMYSADYSLLKYSVIHCFDFLKGMKHLVSHFSDADARTPLQSLLSEAARLLDNDQLKIVGERKDSSELSMVELLTIGRLLRFRFKTAFQQLLRLHAQLDALFGMAMAVNELELTFPSIIESETPFLEAEGLYHILLTNPVSYDIDVKPESNFIFLTGANMAGKSTFIKAIGLSVFLAHAGMGVPAKQMRLSMFNGLLSNINVIDNIVKGESYFYNEVQRIKSTILKVSDHRKWLILIDELFKGTNVIDSMKCSTAVIEGLLKIKNSAFILSTHLYEIADKLKEHPNIRFYYFETQVENERLSFNYQLRDGVSEDRLGYLILKREGVVKMLENL